MDSADRQKLRRLVATLTPEGMDEIQAGIKSEIMQQLQGSSTPDEAFKFKLELDACDNIFLRIKGIVESTPVLTDV